MKQSRSPRGKRDLPILSKIGEKLIFSRILEKNGEKPFKFTSISGNLEIFKKGFFVP
jgi:hypothetical protein